jgi:polyprenyl P-hydroxybenzoate/phenylacrylic acid decarboxylase-like protein
MKRLIIGISGASGSLYGVRLLQVLQQVEGVETHLILSNAARQTLALETEFSVKDVQVLADVVHDSRDIAACISSGSFKTYGMVILPCSIKTLSGIVHSYTDNLLTHLYFVCVKLRCIWGIYALWFRPLNSVLSLCHPCLRSIINRKPFMILLIRQSIVSSINSISNSLKIYSFVGKALINDRISRALIERQYHLL